MEDLAKFVLIGRDRLDAVRAAIRAIDKVGVAVEVREQKLAEAQEIAEAVLDAEVRLGELRKLVEKKTGGDRRSDTFKSDTDVVFENEELEIEKPSETPIKQFDKTTGLTERDNQRFETMANHPEIVERVKADARENGEIVTRKAVLDAIKDEKREKAREEKASRKSYTLEDELPEDACRLFVADIRDGLPMIADESVDFIITDPPYPKEYLPLFGDLSKLAARVLKPGGSLIVMSGQSYLPEVARQLETSMEYHWCLAYLTPGGQSPFLNGKRTNTFWKPVLWYTKGTYDGDYIGDVLKSPPNDNDKKYHKWGQSLGGISEIVEKFTNPGDVILDPFLGGGTTGVAAVVMGRKFVGSDIDETSVKTSRERIKEAYSVAKGERRADGLAR